MYDCAQCKDLWRRYGIATKIHVQLENKLRFAALQSDFELIESLTREAEGAENIRCEVRGEISKHELSHYLTAGCG